MRPRRTLCAALATLGLLLGFAGPATAESRTPKAQRPPAVLSIVRLEGGLLTIRAQGVTQRDILAALAKTLGFELVVTGSLDAPRSLDLRRRPWEEVLKKALFPASWSLVYDADREAALPAMVIVFPSGDAAAETDPGLARAPAPAPKAPAPPAPVEPRWPRDAELRALQERLANADDAKTQLSALRAIADRGGASDVAQALSQLSGRPEDARGLLRVLQGQSGHLPEVKHAIEEMLREIDEEPR